MRLRHAGTALAAVAGSLSLTLTPGATAAPGAGRPHPPAAHVWLTTPDGRSKLADAGTETFTRTTPDVPTAVVDPTRTFQSMTGFGASLTDSSAAVLYRLDRAARDDAMRDLFDPRTGDAIGFLRQPVGGSDFTDGPAYTYDDMPAGQTDYALEHFSVDHDRSRILPLLRRARRLNPRLKIMATPWSPPAWMKTGGSLIGGRLIDEPRIYRAYARYLVKFLRAYEHAGVPVDALTVQNEPQNRTPAGYPGTDMPSVQQRRLIRVLGPALRAAGLDTKILAYDHNWSEHPGDIAGTPPDETGDTDRYPQNVLSDPATARWVAGTAYHCYYGDPGAMSALHRQFPDQDVYFTECSGSRSADPARTFSDTLTWHSRNLVIGATRNWAKTVVTWNLALDADGGPHTGGCGTCTGVLTVGADGTVTRNAEYYTLGHLSRFVRPGAVRVASTSFGTTGWNGRVMAVAFRNPDGSTVLVAHNENDDPRPFAVSQNGWSFARTLPGGALATFVWPASRVLTAGLPRSLDPAGWSATADPAGSAAEAVDDDASTRYSTGAAQRPGQYLQVDLGARTRTGRLVLDTGADTGDYPRGYAVRVSRDGTHWSAPVASGAGDGQFTDVRFPARSLRYVRVTLTAPADSWWSVADVRAYRP